MEHASVLAKTDQTSAAYVVRPTIFDLLAHENMRDLLRPAFWHIVKWLCRVRPSWATHVLRDRVNEAYVLVHSVVELAYLAHYDALFTEYFYGLKRVEMRTGKRILSVLTSVIVPYLKVKLDDFYEELEKNPVQCNFF